MNSILKLSNGQELYVNFLDVEINEKFRIETKKIQKTMQELSRLDDDIEVSKRQIEAMKLMIDNIFGQGEGERLFNGKLDLVILIEIVEGLVTMKQEQELNYTARAKAIAEFATETFKA